MAPSKKRRLRRLKVERVDTVGDPANPEARVMLLKARNPIGGDDMPDLPDLKDRIRKAVEEATAETASQLDETRSELTEARAELETTRTELEEAKAQLDDATSKDDGDGDGDGDEIDKSKLPPAVRARLDELEKSNRASADAIAKMVDEAAAKQWADVARGLDLVAVVPPDADVTKSGAGLLGSLLHRVAKSAGDEVAGEVVDVLRTAQERLAASDLLGEIGRPGTPSTNSGHAQLEELAKAHQKKNQGLTLQQAYDQVAQVNPDLVRKAQAEVWSS